MSSGHLDLEGLFLVNGNAERVDWLRQRYDSGEEVELEKEADLASAVSLLRLFLQELPEPVIPTAMQGHILQLHQGVWLGHSSLFSRLSCLSETNSFFFALFWEFFIKCFLFVLSSLPRACCLIVLQSLRNIKSQKERQAYVWTVHYCVPMSGFWSKFFFVLTCYVCGHVHFSHLSWIHSATVKLLNEAETGFHNTFGG